MPLTPQDQGAQDDFLTAAFSLFARVEAVVAERTKDYNDTVPITTNIPDAATALAVATMKISRLNGLLQTWNRGVRTQATKDRMYDSLVDAVAYLAFMYGWLTEDRNGPQ